jgi:hypothetical protein
MSQSHSRRARPRLEALEARTLLNNRFVVPAGVPVDFATTFPDLQTALSTAGLVVGDAVQIEPGSAPGNVTLLAPPVANLTIQGDPAAPLASIPQWTLSATFTESAAQTGFTLRNVNVGLISAGAVPNDGALVFNANATVTGCTLVNINSFGLPLTLGGTTDVLTNTTVISGVPDASTIIDVVTPAGGSNHLIANNTFVAAGFHTFGMAGAALAYQNGMGVPVTDRVVNNTFVQFAGRLLGEFILVQQPVTGLVIQGNTFSGVATATAIVQGSTPQNLQIVGNTINLAGAGRIGISLTGGGAGTTVSATVTDNRIATGGTGTGIMITAGTAATSVLNLKIQGNDLHNNQIGVQVTGATGPVGGIDLGGGTQGSLGGNNFRGFTAAATPTAGAIVVTGVAGAQGTVHAQHNLFAAGVTPGAVVSDPGGNLDLGNPLTGNAAFVADLYEDFLRRAADTTSASDALPIVNALNAGSVTPAQVAAAIARSGEALGVVVDGLYQKLLGRAADPTGRAGFVSLLQGGGTLEQVVAFLVTSGEYAAAVGGTDFGFVQSLYTKLLGRQAANSEIPGWLGLLPSIGRAGVANAILASAEFRGAVVRQFYGTTAAPAVSITSLLPALLHRATVSAVEVNGWVGSGLDLLTIEVMFAQTTDYFTAG